MKRRDPKFIGCKGIIFAIIIIAGGLLAPAYCQLPGVTLLLQQTPTQGGVITPNTGIYHYAPNSEVTLTAMPKPGFRFVYWLGDVSEPTTSYTVVQLNEPKIVVAVFEPIDNDTLVASENLPAGGGGGYYTGGGLSPSATDFGRPTAAIMGGGAGPKLQGPVLLSLQANDGMAETPEPATGVLLVLGSMFVFARRRIRKQAR